MDAFINLQKQLMSEPVMAFACTNRQYALITDANTGTADTSGGLGGILTQVDQDRKFYAISFTSRQLKDHEKITHHFYLKQQPQSGAWITLTSISKEKNSSSTLITSHWKNWDIYTAR